MREYFRVESRMGNNRYWSGESHHRKLSRANESKRKLAKFYAKFYTKRVFRVVHVREEVVG